MKIIKDRDFKIALFISLLHSLLVLLRLILSTFFYYSFYSKNFPGAYSSLSEFLGIKRMTENIPFELKLILTIFIVVYLTLKILKINNPKVRFYIGLAYSLMSSLLLVFIVFSSYYKSEMDSLGLFLGTLVLFPAYTIISLPAILLFIKNFTTTTSLPTKSHNYYMLLPTILGTVISILIIFLSPFIYKPIYTYNTHLLQKKFIVKPVSISYYRSAKEVVGTLDISKEVEFDVNIDIYLNYRSPSDKYRYAGCGIDPYVYGHFMSKDSESIVFRCYITPSIIEKYKDIRKITYILQIKEELNSNVQIQKTLTVNDFANSENLIHYSSDFFPPSQPTNKTIIITPTSTLPNSWKTYQNNDVTFLIPPGLVESPILIRGSGYTQEFDDPENKLLLSFFSQGNYNQISGKPFADIDEYINMPYTVQTVIVDGQDGRQPSPRAGSENVYTAVFFSKDAKNIYNIELKLVNVTKLTQHERNDGFVIFDQIIKSFKFKN